MMGHPLVGESIGELGEMGREIATNWGRACGVRAREDAGEEEFEWQDGSGISEMPHCFRYVEHVPAA